LDPKELGGSARVERMLHNHENYLGYVPGYRRAHARGVAFRGTFTASPNAQALTTAEHLQGEPVATVVRLSNGGSHPYRADRESLKDGTALGLAIRFALPSGGDAEWAGMSINAFPPRTPDDLIGFTEARRPGKRGKPNLLRLAAFLLRHRQCLPGLKAVRGFIPPKSFATCRFNGLHAYYLVDAEGTRRAFRYRWMPLAEPAGLTLEEDRFLPPQYLVSEIEQRCAAAPVSWDLVLQLAKPRDPTDDMTKQWPESRRLVTVGRLVIDRLHEDQELVDRSRFDPTKVPPGIEVSNDPVLHFRSEVYAASQQRRLGETKPAIRPG